MRDIDEPARADDTTLHQIQNVGAGGEISCARLRGGRDGFFNRRRPDILERFHATSLRRAAPITRCASRTASVMP